MKALLITVLLAGGIINANGQSVANVVASNEESYVVKSMPANINNKKIEEELYKNLFKKTTVDLKNDELIFHNLPQTGTFKVYVTNTRGWIYLKEDVNIYHRSIDVSTLPHGLHFVTIMGDHKSRKAFVIHI